MNLWRPFTPILKPSNNVRRMSLTVNWSWFKPTRVITWMLARFQWYRKRQGGRWEFRVDRWGCNCEFRGCHCGWHTKGTWVQVLQFTPAHLHHSVKVFSQEDWVPVFKLDSQNIYR